MSRIQVLFIIMLGFLLSGISSAASISEGPHYEKIRPAVNTTASGNEIEVVEMFWYGCPHCFQFEPHLQKWLKKKPANVKFVRVPATFRPLWKLHARAFYTAEILGVGEKLHKPMFDAYHLERNRLDSEQKLRELFVKHGVKGSDFDDTFHSFAVETRLARAVDLSERYGISGVPSMIVNGKYRNSSKLHDQNKILEVVDFLIKKESKR